MITQMEVTNTPWKGHLQLTTPKRVTRKNLNEFTAVEMGYCFFENGSSFKGLWAENFENGMPWIYSPPRMTRNLVIFCRGSPTTLPQPWRTKWINILFELFRKGTFPLTFPWTPLVFQCLCRQKMKGSIQRLILVTGMRGPQKTPRHGMLATSHTSASGGQKNREKKHSQKKPASLFKF